MSAHDNDMPIVENKTVTAMPQTMREPEYEAPLDPARLRLFRDGTGRLRLTIEGDRSYLDVKVARAFPMSFPDRHFALLDDRDRCIGMIETLDGLDSESQGLARDALSHRYFIPAILRLNGLREEFGVVYFDVQTDHGWREFVVRGLRDSIEDFGHGQLMITDTDGNRFRTHDWKTLDARSRRLLESFI